MLSRRSQDLEHRIGACIHGAVAIKDDNKNNLIFTLFNKQTEKIMTPYCIYQYKTMDTICKMRLRTKI